MSDPRERSRSISFFRSCACVILPWTFALVTQQCKDMHSHDGKNPWWLSGTALGTARPCDFGSPGPLSGRRLKQPGGHVILWLSCLSIFSVAFPSPAE
jgi:hypothetical protein